MDWEQGYHDRLVCIEMKTVAIIAARMGSQRLPGKVLMNLGDNRTMIDWVYQAAEAATLVNDIWIATTTENRDDAIVNRCKSMGYQYWRGSEKDVLDRFYGCAKEANADIIIRLTGDCPFLDPRIIDEVITLRQQTGASYASNVDPPTYPDGLDVQVLTIEALSAAHREATRATDRDTVCEYVSRHRDLWPSRNLVCGIPNLWGYRWVLDTEEDLAFARAAIHELGNAAQSMISMLDLMRRKPEIQAINYMWRRNERFFSKIAEEV